MGLKDAILQKVLRYVDDTIGKKYKIIDDITDTGKTLNNYKKMDSSEIAYYVTIHEHEQSSVKPDYSVLYKEDKWIVYPWEVKDSTEIQDYLK